MAIHFLRSKPFQKISFPLKFIKAFQISIFQTLQNLSFLQNDFQPKVLGIFFKKKYMEIPFEFLLNGF